ncbi:hypothetical protein POJ06DRAFT_265719 [Lipomyces tetrasporus]|uniref:DNA mismatch repair protein S5 domain-containing protein n=1 Tax=Lipomyces tetrasporus TaxID=54092 RepID=A0AAD7QX14_9ASCO|nr:uncharacterized protein POJ06DRAFT_265719 [Lipomyces tetrasporus]KAJ8102858.1 hypothetical protein POJ06DRAFT_265719 [Lipomyces tetrasporus]
MQSLPDNLVSLLRSEVSIDSVAKCIAELVRNSLDAAAAHVDIFLRSSNLYVLVKDDGHGITPDDMRRIGRRHFTSKCRDFKDLDSITSFGFRGEALADIAAISHLTVTSRHTDYRSTNTVKIMNSNEVYNGPSTTPLKLHGTHVVVQNLFNNLPVRRKSILDDSNKSLRDEIMISVKNCLVDVALSLQSEAVNIRFISDSGVVLNLIIRPENKNAACTVLNAAYGQAMIKAFDTFNGRCGDVTISGMVSLNPTSTKTYQYIFLNRRKMAVSAIHKTLSDLFSKSLYCWGGSSDGSGYRKDPSLAAVNMHPIFVIHVNAPLSGYDLCQDPGKVLVDMENYGEIGFAIVDSVRNMISRLPMLPDPPDRGLTTLEMLLVGYFTQVVRRRMKRSHPLLFSPRTEKDQTELCAKLMYDFSVSQEDFDMLARWQVQLELWGVRYILGDLTGRPIMTGMTIDDVDQREFTVRITHCPALLMERFLEEPELVKALILRHVYDLRSGDVTKLVPSQTTGFINNGSIESTEMLLEFVYRCLPRVILDLLISKACRGAIMFGDSLSEDRCRRLIYDLSKCRFPFQCAHGRPSMVPLVDLGAINSEEG